MVLPHSVISLASIYGIYCNSFATGVNRSSIESGCSSTSWRHNFCQRLSRKTAGLLNGAGQTTPNCFIASRRLRLNNRRVRTGPAAKDNGSQGPADVEQPGRSINSIELFGLESQAPRLSERSDDSDGSLSLAAPWPRCCHCHHNFVSPRIPDYCSRDCEEYDDDW